MLDRVSNIFNEIYYVWWFPQTFNMLDNICPTFEKDRVLPLVFTSSTSSRRKEIIAAVTRLSVILLFVFLCSWVICHILNEMLIGLFKPFKHLTCHVWTVCPGLQSLHLLLYSMYWSPCTWYLNQYTGNNKIHVVFLHKQQVLIRDLYEIFTRTRVQYTILSWKKYNSILALSPYPMFHKSYIL